MEWNLHLIIHLQNLLRGKENLIVPCDLLQRWANKLNLFLKDAKLSFVLEQLWLKLIWTIRNWLFTSIFTCLPAPLQRQGEQATELTVHCPLKGHAAFLFHNTDSATCRQPIWIPLCPSYMEFTEATATSRNGFSGESDWATVKMAHYMQKVQQPQKCPLVVQGKQQHVPVWLKRLFQVWLSSISGNGLGAFLDSLGWPHRNQSGHLNKLLPAATCSITTDVNRARLAGQRLLNCKGAQSLVVADEAFKMLQVSHQLILRFKKKPAAVNQKNYY